MESYGQLKLELIRKGLVIPKEVRDLSEVSCGYCDGQPGEGQQQGDGVVLARVTVDDQGERIHG